MKLGKAARLVRYFQVGGSLNMLSARPLLLCRFPMVSNSLWQLVSARPGSPRYSICGIR